MFFYLLAKYHGPIHLRFQKDMENNGNTNKSQISK